ncbi:MAG: hypothetical protein K2L35_03870 [Muribaculaceae bacterium]|nr:hypothetical protein [Muribaculaceae bacterium]MDE5957399.1 hypothetical protein [Muribaculaceae bacterium]MDE6447436.1 hypothetical protein [Muribaculaceae bacterium]
MVNKREFKKFADALGTSVAQEMMVAYYNVEGIDREAVGEAVQKVLLAVEEAKNNANRFFDRGAKSFESRREYSVAKRKFFRQLFAKIEKDFSEQVNAGLKQFNAALPAEVKQAQKEAAR